MYLAMESCNHAWTVMCLLTSKTIFT